MSPNITTESGIKVELFTESYMIHGDPSSDTPPPWMGCGGMCKDSGWHVVDHSRNSGGHDITPWAMAFPDIAMAFGKDADALPPSSENNAADRIVMISIWGQNEVGHAFAINHFDKGGDRVCLYLPKWVTAARAFHTYDTSVPKIMNKRMDQIKDGWVPPNTDRRMLEFQGLDNELQSTRRIIDRRESEIRNLKNKIEGHKAHITKLQIWDDL